MRTLFIFNPHSGRHRTRARLHELLRDFTGARAADAALVTTEGPGHATELAGDAVRRGCPRVVAVGGDGTMNEVAQALLHTPAALALVPCGSGNGLARHLGLPAAPSAALALAADAAAHTGLLDTGSVGGRPFFNAMGLGLDAEVSRRFNLLTVRGLPAYARTAFAAFARRRSETCSVGCDSGPRETLEILLIAVANSDQYGNGALIAPGARVDDGLLDLVAVRPVGLPGALVLGARLFHGSLERSPRVRRLRGARFVIGRPAPGIIHTDGEIHPAGATLEIAVHPRSLRVVLPAATRAVTRAGSATSRLALHTP